MPKVKSCLFTALSNETEIFFLSPYLQLAFTAKEAQVARRENCSCFNKDWVFSGVQRWARLTIPMALLYPASFQCPLPQHILKNGCIVIVQIHNLFVFCTGPWSLCAGLLFWLISFKLHSSSAYSKGK